MRNIKYSLSRLVLMSGEHLEKLIPRQMERVVGTSKVYIFRSGIHTLKKTFTHGLVLAGGTTEKRWTDCKKSVVYIGV